jgi:hypothetical protein
VGRCTYCPAIQTYCPPRQLQWPGCQTAIGEGGDGGVSTRGGGGANGATLTKVVPALLGAAPGKIVGPYGCAATLGE